MGALVAGRPPGRGGSAREARAHADGESTDDVERSAQARSRRWRAVGALAVLVLLLAGAVRVGLWWSGTDRTSPTSALTLPGSAAQPAPGEDWAAVVAILDAARAAALTARDPDLLAYVYTADAAARAADARRIAAMRSSGYHVTAAAHQVGTVTLVHRSADGAVTVRVTEAMPAYAVLDDQGATVGSTKAVHSVVTMELQATPEGFRIASIDPA